MTSADRPLPTVAVIGAGPIGAATARWLAEAGHQVAVIGPEEPADAAAAEGPWSAHYDSGRIGAVDAMYVPTVLGVRAMRRFADLSERSGVPFTSDMPLLTTFPEDAPSAADDSAPSWRNADALIANSREQGEPIEVVPAAAMAARFPELRLPDAEFGLLQQALLINPRELTRAELALATRAGAERVVDVVTAIAREGDRWVLELRDGGRREAERVVVATGAYAATDGLLDDLAPGRLATAVFGCTIVLMEVADPAACDFPGYMFAGGGHGGGLITPPRQYPDGRWYIKGAGGELVDHPLASAAEIDAWVATGGSADEADWFTDFVARTVPGAEIVAVHTKPCLPTFNASGLPYIDTVADGLVLATEGERGVMMADEIGRLAAGLAGQGRWVDPIPRHLFTARWGD